ncbi:MAG: DoxX family protein [Aridibacter famidurans]|nr:DoxX family protein [Aridibacter famidurans]
MRVLRVLHPVSRSLIALIFLVSGLAKAFEFDRTTALMAAAGVGFPDLFLAGAIAFEIAGGLALMLGYKTRYAAAALIFLLVSVTFIFHARLTGDPVSGQEQFVHVLKNLAIIGGLTRFVLDGGGFLSLDRRFERREIVI